MSNSEVMQIVEALLENESFKAAFVGIGICSAAFGGVFWGLINLFWDFVDMIIKKRKEKNL